MEYVIKPVMNEGAGVKRALRCLLHRKSLTLVACMDWQYGEADCLFGLYVCDAGCRYIEDSCNNDSAYRWAWVTQEEADFFASLPNLHTHGTAVAA